MYFLKEIFPMVSNLFSDIFSGFINLVWSYLRALFITPTLTFVIDESCSMASNQLYEAAEVYLLSKIYDDNAEAPPRIKIDLSTQRLYVSATSRDRRFTVAMADGEEIVDTYPMDPKGPEIKLTWRFVHTEETEDSHEKRYFELIFEKKFKDTVFEFYLNHILDIFDKANAKNESKKVLKLWDPSGKSSRDFITLEHPATFKTLAMDPDLTQDIIKDLDLFKRRKEFYNRVGRAWKRGYLLNGPPGTGKSSLVAAMANHLKFDIYDLQLTKITSDDELRSILLNTRNRSIVVIEDIDRIDMSVQPPTSVQPSTCKFTLPGLLNFIDGLWSSCGDERIIVFTTNDMEKLDKALLRPGRMDKVINMPYCTKYGFKVLANNYLKIEIENSDFPKFYREIEDIIESKKVTPAEVAENLMTKEIEKADDNLQVLFEFLNKKDESNEIKVEGINQTEDQKPKEVEIDEGEELIETSAKEL